MSRGKSRDRSRCRDSTRDLLTSANGQGSRVAHHPWNAPKTPLEAP